MCLHHPTCRRAAATAQKIVNKISYPEGALYFQSIQVRMKHCLSRAMYADSIKHATIFFGRGQSGSTQRVANYVFCAFGF